jgi:ABC-type dipeptide/oligopeptide/nickel transport system permease component
MHRWVRTEGNPLGKYVSNVIQSNFAWVICSNRSGGYPPKRSLFVHMSLSLLLSFILEDCAGCHLQGSWTCTCISSLSLFFSTLIVFWAGNALLVLKGTTKLEWKARGYWYCPIWLYNPKQDSIDLHSPLNYIKNIILEIYSISWGRGEVINYPAVMTCPYLLSILYLLSITIMDL